MEVLQHDTQAKEIIIYSDDMPLDAWREYGYDDAPEIEIKIAYDFGHDKEETIIMGAWDGETEIHLTTLDISALRDGLKDHLESEQKKAEEVLTHE